MLTKSQLSTLLHSISGLNVGEGEHFFASAGSYPKVAYWETVWTDDMASGDDYEVIVTYQISFASLRPRDPALLSLKDKLNAAGEHPTMYHEYVAATDSPGYFHTYMSIDLLEELEVPDGGS